MRFLILLLTIHAAFAAAPVASTAYTSLGDDAGSWPDILSSIGLERQSADTSRIFVARSGAAAPEWATRVEGGAFLILEGRSPLAEQFGFRAGKATVKVSSVADKHAPELSIVWQSPAEVPVFELPKGAEVFAADRWTRAPLIAGIRRGTGGVLWVALPPGERGYERFPYLLKALSDLGIEAPFRSTRLWAFFDSVLPHARGSGLLRRPLAKIRDRRPARRRLALLRARSGTGSHI